VDGRVDETRGLHLGSELRWFKERQGGAMHVATDPTPEQTGRTSVREFDNHDTSCLAQNPSHFAENLGLILRVMESDDRHDPVEIVVGKGNRFSTALLEPECGSPLPTHGDFLPVRLQDRDLATALGEPFRRRPGTSSDVEQTQGGRRREKTAQDL